MENVFANFLLNAGLYDKMEIQKDNIDELIQLINGDVRINAYCTGCKTKRVFSMKPITFLFPVEGKQQIRPLAGTLRSLQNVQDMIVPTISGATKEWYWSNSQCEDAVRVIQFPFFCSMDEKHHLDFIVQTEGTTMRKIGQYPSLADMSFPELKEYRKVADEADLRELRRAIGLHAQGIGIGSYVYLRRIFERIVCEAGKNAVSEGTVAQEEFHKARMDEKIKSLKDYLPNILIETPEFYGIVSKGIHELSEQECIEYFPIMQEAIMMILREWEEKRKQAESEKNLKASLSKIASKIK